MGGLEGGSAEFADDASQLFYRIKSATAVVSMVAGAWAPGPLRGWKVCRWRH